MKFRRKILASVLLCAAAAMATAVMAQTAKKIGPPLEVVKSFDSFPLVGIGVSHQGRVFASAPGATQGNRLVEVDAKTGAVTPYPDASWNTGPQGQAHTQWVVAQAMWVDTADHLWVLDTGKGAAPPKLVEFDLTANAVIRSYGFDGVVAPTDSLNDVRVDLIHGYAYLTNIGNAGSLVVLDLKTGKSRQVLVADRSTKSAPGQHLMIGNQVALAMDGKPRIIHADGIAMSPDAAWLYYRPLTDHNYWRAPTGALRDAALSPADVAKKVEFLGSAELTGGLIMGPHDTLYGGDLEHSSVVALTLDPATHEYRSKVFANQPGKLSWADGFAISGGYLYIADSHLWEVGFKNNLPRSGPFTIFKVKLPK